MINHYECTPEGWHKITKPLEESLVAMGVKILQMKQKFGDLRVYFRVPNDMSDEDIDKVVDMVNAAEEKCASLCEVCGAANSVCKETNGWVGVTCEECGK